MCQVVDNNQPVLSDDQLTATVNAVINALPEIGKVRQAGITFEDLHKEYVFTTSTVWQAIGNLLAERLKATNPDGKTRKIAPESFASEAGRWIKSVTDAKKWNVSNPVWVQQGREVVAYGAVGTQKGFVRNATEVLRDLTNN
jgi:hypothetical protein